MPQAAEVRDSWADPPPDAPSRFRRREVDSWASADELEVLGGIGADPSADWTVLTLERDAAGVRDIAASRAAGRAAATIEPDHPSDHATERHLTLVGDDGERPADRPRRTVVIRGRVAERQAPLTHAAERRRPARRPSERIGHRPDRVALWAVVLGMLLILVAVLSAGG